MCTVLHIGVCGSGIQYGDKTSPKKDGDIFVENKLINHTELSFFLNLNLI